MLKKFKLTDKADFWFDRGQPFMFQVGYSVPDPNSGGTIYRHWKRCPIISLDKPDSVVSTTNERAQDLLEAMIVPQKTTRRGVLKPNGRLFLDVTQGDDPVDLDLDPIFQEG